MQTVLMACCTPVRFIQIAFMHSSEPRLSDIVHKPGLLPSEPYFVLFSSLDLVRLKHQQDLGTIMIVILWPLTDIGNIRANSGQASKIFSFKLLHYHGPGHKLSRLL